MKKRVKRLPKSKHAKTKKEKQGKNRKKVIVPASPRLFKWKKK